MIAIEFTVSCADWERLDNLEALARRAVVAAFDVTGGPPEEPVSVSLLFADDAEIRALNADWRDKDKPTNVLSFPASHPPGMPGPELLGDIVLAFETCAREAGEEGKTLADHASHLIVHGTLHLLGYDHMTDEEAEEMEALEIEALARLGIEDPYEGGEISA